MQIGVCHWHIIPVHANSWVCSAINHKVVNLVVLLPDFVSNVVENDEGLALRVIAFDSLHTPKISGGFWPIHALYYLMF